jgi:hypothetical protein
VGKIIAKILQTRLLHLTVEVLPESQCGFRPNRGTSDMIFAARQLQEKCREQQKPLYVAFFDLTKAFDSVNREALFKILNIYGCPNKFINILRLLHDDMEASVKNDNSFTEPFKIGTGVKQGCIIAPTLFSIYLAAMLQQTTDTLPEGINITYRMDGKLFNLSRLKARTKISQTSVIELQYADDSMICAQSEQELQRIVNVFVSAFTKMGLEVNIGKTKVMYQPPPHLRMPSNIVINAEPLENVENFPYLGSHLSTSVNVESEIKHRIAVASASYGKMRKRIFENHDLTVKTKVTVFNAVVIPTLLYGCETWTLYRRHINTLERFNQRCLRKMMGITWREKRTNLSVLQSARSTSIESLIMRHQLRWVGHVIRMPDERIPKQLLYSQLTDGLRPTGRPMLRYRDTIKSHLIKCGIDSNMWEGMASNRPGWRRVVYKGVEGFEENRRRVVVEKRNIRKAQERERNNGRPPDFAGPACPTCGRVCRSEFGLRSHIKVHVRPAHV